MRNSIQVVSILGLLTVGCSSGGFTGSKNKDQQSASDVKKTNSIGVGENGSQLIEATEWCVAWELDCSQEGEFDSKIAQFAGDMFIASGKTDTKLSFSMADVKSDEVKQAVALINGTKTLADITSILDQLGVETVTVENATIAKTGKPGSINHVNIDWNLDADVALTFNEATSAAINGFSMSSSNGQGITLQSASLEGERVKIIGDNFSVDNIHPYFFAESSEETSETKVDTESDVKIAAAVEAGMALYPKFFNGVNQIVFDSAFLDNLRAKLPSIVDNMPAQADQALQAVQSLNIGTNKVPLDIKFDKALDMTISGECADDFSVGLALEETVKIASIANLEDEKGMKIIFEGIEVDVNNVPIIGSMSLTLDEIDVTTEGARIYNIPLIGSYFVSFAELEGDEGEDEEEETEEENAQCE